MCLIVEKRVGDSLPFDEVQSWHGANSDGYGVMYIEDGAVHVEKGYKFKALWGAIRRHEGRAYYLHLRMATHGQVDDRNTHPYQVAPGVFLMHNGIVDIDTGSNPDRSDTWHWVESVLRPLLATQPDPGTAIRSPWFRAMVEAYGGPSNRFVFMDKDGAVTMNDANWHTFKATGMRVSNTYALGFKRWAPPVPVGSVADLWKGLPGVPAVDQEWNKRGWDVRNRLAGAEALDLGVDEDTGQLRDIWEEDEPTPADDLRLMYGMDLGEVCAFVYEYPDRAAAVIHDLINNP